LRHPVILKQWEIEDSIVISRQVSNKEGVLHFEKIITTCPGIGIALVGGFDFD